ncbi:MAG TPA: IS66 family transposase, partial [Nitrososphaera sp.]|nr:IS66 family transposase [Nitrososphaera sp.]
STICGWHTSLAESLRPLYCGMHIDLLKSEVIGTDDTPVKVQDRKKKQNIKRGHEWICIGDKNHPVNMFFYTHGRGRDGPKRFLHGFTGYLLGDCFSGNRALCAETGATFVACLAHARRYFQKALPNNRPAAEEALRMFGELFKIESDAKDWEISAEMVARLRQEEAVPVLNKLKAWLDVQVLSAVPKSSLGKAVSYCLNNWDFLNNYLLDGNARIDNNLSEQQMKKVAIGRKNWYFFGSDEGGEHASILLSVFSTALRHGLRPSEYICDVLQKLRKDRNCDIEPLLAHNWKANREKAEIEGFQATPQMAF